MSLLVKVVRILTGNNETIILNALISLISSINPYFFLENSVWKLPAIG